MVCNQILVNIICMSYLITNCKGWGSAMVPPFGGNTVLCDFSATDI